MRTHFEVFQRFLKKPPNKPTVLRSDGFTTLQHAAQGWGSHRLAGPSASYCARITQSPQRCRAACCFSSSPSSLPAHHALLQIPSQTRCRNVGPQRQGQTERTGQLLACCGEVTEEPVGVSIMGRLGCSHRVYSTVIPSFCLPSREPVGTALLAGPYCSPRSTPARGFIAARPHTANIRTTPATTVRRAFQACQSPE